MDIRTLRTDFPALEQYLWFQNGGVSITPQPVADEHTRLMQELLERGPMHIVYPNEEYPRRQRSIERIAEFFAVAPSELALMRGVSEAYQTVLRGITWQSGDEVVITVEEEAAILLPTLHLRDRAGVRIRKVPLYADVERQIGAIQENLSRRTRLVAFSHVTTDLGFRLPVREICDLARSHGVPTFVDLAHSAGVFPYSLDELGCDYAGMLSYKWMYSPYAAGALFVRRDSLDSLDVTYAGGRSEKRLDFAADQYELRDTAERFQFGPWAWPLVHTWAFALDYLDEVGRHQIWERTAALTARLKDGLQAISGVTLLTPILAERSAALVSFSLSGWTGTELAERLRRDWNMIVKPLPHGDEGLRISICFFTLEEEVDQLLSALRTLE